MMCWINIKEIIKNQLIRIEFEKGLDCLIKTLLLLINHIMIILNRLLIVKIKATNNFNALKITIICLDQNITNIEYDWFQQSSSK